MLNVKFNNKTVCAMRCEHGKTFASEDCPCGTFSTVLKAAKVLLHSESESIWYPTHTEEEKNNLIAAKKALIEEVEDPTSDEIDTKVELILEDEEKAMFPMMSNPPKYCLSPEEYAAKCEEAILYLVDKKKTELATEQVNYAIENCLECPEALATELHTGTCDIESLTLIDLNADFTGVEENDLVKCDGNLFKVASVTDMNTLVLKSGPVAAINDGSYKLFRSGFLNQFEFIKN